MDNHGYVLAPVPVAPVNETDMVLLPEGLHALKQVAKEVGLDLRGAYLNLDGGFDSAHNRKCIFNAGMIPNIKENPRNRKTPKRGRKRMFNTVIHALRMRVERTFAWEDKFKRLLLRFERIQQRHYGMKISYHPQSGWFEDTPLKGGPEEGCPLKGVQEDTFLLEAR